MRLYNAICSWLEATAFAKLTTAGASEEPQPEGNNFSHVEHAHSYTSMPELHEGYRPESIDWIDRAGRIGFRPNP